MTVALLFLMSFGLAAESQDASGDSIASPPFVAILSDGTKIEASSFSTAGQYVYLKLPDGRMIAYSRDEVHLEAVSPPPQDREKTSQQSEDEARSTVPASKPDNASAMSAAAGVLTLPDTSKQAITVVGEQGKTPGELGEVETGRGLVAGSDAGQGNYLEGLIERNEAEHVAALTEYENRIAGSASIRDELVAMDWRAANACDGYTRVIGVGLADVSNEYGGFWSGSFVWGALISNESTPYCRSLLADCYRLSAQVRGGLKDLSDFARKNGILPGEARALLSRYALRNR
jgi:hypothetical protein